VKKVIIQKSLMNI